MTKYVFYFISILLFGGITYYLVSHYFFSNSFLQNSSIKKIVTPPPPKASLSLFPENSSEDQVPDKDSYPVHKNIKATFFWVGEDASDENDYIPNKSSAWDSNWLNSFGGIDTAYAREGYYPKHFTPQENPFYVALPYNDFTQNGKKDSVQLIPWYDPSLPESHSQVKNRWVRVQYKNISCYGQWEDVGPFEDDDFEYVFGEADPKEKRAGIDLSPAMKTCLRMATNGEVSWQFIADEDVPDGPWKEIVTTSQINW